ncbi:MAG: phosphoenolpyruvate carboxylase, partial [Acidobacteria bacterium]|nr:phosphoenolpyruvate carboxylase [Acidobacteriota bacterium]
MPSLWTPANWPQRLAELLAPTGELKEVPLRRDVRSLGMLLGEVLKEQSGPALYEAVEQLRRTAITRREADSTGDTANATSSMQQALLAVHTHANDLTRVYQLARAFSFYFELINLAETNHRKRRRQSGQLNDAPPPRGDLRGTLRRLKESGLDAKQALALLSRVVITPVFTAHPTEVARRSVTFKRRRISDLLEKLDRIAVPEAELEALEREVTAEITALWQTDDVRSARPMVRDEIRMALDYYEASLFDTLPVLYTEVAAAFEAEYGQQTSIAELPQLVNFGSWIGGDRDGNPFVTADVTEWTVHTQMKTALNEYRARVLELRQTLTHS